MKVRFSVVIGVLVFALLALGFFTWQTSGKLYDLNKEKDKEIASLKIKLQDCTNAKTRVDTVWKEKVVYRASIVPRLVYIRDTLYKVDTLWISEVEYYYADSIVESDHTLYYDVISRGPVISMDLGCKVKYPQTNTNSTIYVTPEDKCPKLNIYAGLSAGINNQMFILEGAATYKKLGATYKYETATGTHIIGGLFKIK